MTRAVALSISVLVACCVGGCSEGASSGAGEPVRIYRLDDNDNPVLATFFDGKPAALTPAPDANASVAAGSEAGTAASAEAAGAAIEATKAAVEMTSFEEGNRIVYPGRKLSAMKGRITKNAAAVAVSFDMGTGYWVIPAGAPDATNEQEDLEWKMRCDFSPDISPGFHKLTATAVGADGRFGTSLTKDLCIAGHTADGINPCVPTQAVPEAVISLHWDTDVDLDLQVVVPDEHGSRIVSSKHPATLDPDASGQFPDEVGIVDRDSNGGCSIDGIRYENLVFNKVKPAKGTTFGIYVDLFDACKQASVRFTVSVYVASRQGDQNQLELVGSRQGMLLASQASGGQPDLGTYLFEVTF
ncbi:MAG TPA: hypothetical protein VIV60_35805 [Polyangiaceae bacterium]